MFKNVLIVTLALCTVAPAAWSQAEKVLYTGIEASTDNVTVPSSATGTWSITPCAGCNMLHLKLDASSRYFVGQDEVPLATLRTYAARGSSTLLVAFETKTQRVTKIKLGTQLDAKDISKKPAKAPRGGALESRTQS